MLATALWFALLFVGLSAVALDGAAAFTRAGLHAAAAHAVEGAMTDALADYQNRLGTAIARETAALDVAPFSGNAPSFGGFAEALASLPAPLQHDARAGSGAFTTTYSVVPTTLSAPSCSADASTGPDVIGWLQCSPLVQESRLSLRVDVVVHAADGSALAQRVAYVSLRLFAIPPYSSLVGAKDGAAPGTDAHGAPSTAHESDLGGESLVPGAGTGARPQAGTSIHVRYVCIDGAGNCANAAPPDPDSDLRGAVHWSDGNAPSP